MTESGDEPIRLGDRYELGGLLGRGGMADVRVGRDLRLGRTVAIKQLRVDLASDPTFQERFRREGQSAAALNHPSIVAVYDTGEALDDSGHTIPYIVMEYVEGQTLREVMRDGRKILPERALSITADVLSGLDYSHRSGIIHRDIKPANVMLTPSGQVKVMDFGIARAIADASSGMTQTAAVIGTAQYLSPEQARGETVDARSDIYSTGCLLYELLTGRPPFVGESPVSVAYQHVREEAKPPSQLNPDVTATIDNIVAKALAKRTDDRYQSAADMRADIERALGGQAIAAPTTAATSAIPAAVPAATSTIGAPVLPPPSGGARRADDEGGGQAKWWALGALVVIALLVLAFFLIKGNGPSAPTQVAVPDVSGKTVDVATRQLENAGFTVGTTKEESSDSVDKGNVISTDPAAGTDADKGSSIDLTVSAGPKQVTVPDLDGYSYTQAKALLEGSQYGLNVKREDQDSDLAKGQVINSDPPAGTAVDVGSDITLKISKGQATVPNVVGKSLDDAKKALDDAGLKYQVTSDPSSTAPKDQVTAQDQPAGTKVAPGTTINLTVSTGDGTDQSGTATDGTDQTGTATDGTDQTSTATDGTTTGG